MRRGGGAVAALAALSGALAVAAGAFAAHGAGPRAAELLKTGAHYQLIHAVAALVALGRPRGAGAAWLFVVGGALFAGSLYALAFGGPRAMGAVTPLGGLALIGGWLWLAQRAASAKLPSNDSRRGERRGPPRSVATPCLERPCSSAPATRSASMPTSRPR